MTADLSASAFDFMIVVATCICVLAALAAIRLVTILIISIRKTLPNAGTLPGDRLKNAGMARVERRIMSRT